MILEEETKERFGYYPSDLKQYSCKPILAMCDDCGTVRVLPKNNYHALCHSCGMKGYPCSEETKQKLSKANKGRPVSAETRKKLSDAQKGEKSAWFGKHHSEETRKKMSDALKGKHHSEETKKKMSETTKKQYQDPEFAMQMHQATAKRPTKPEKIWRGIAIEKHSLPFKYTGDGKVAIGGKCPDFIHLTKKIVVEIFGKAFHSPLFAFVKLDYSRTYKGTIEHYKKHGYKCIIFWDADMLRESAEQFVLSVLKKEGIKVKV